MYPDQYENAAQTRVKTARTRIAFPTYFSYAEDDDDGPAHVLRHRESHAESLYAVAFNQGMSPQVHLPLPVLTASRSIQSNWLRPRRKQVEVAATLIAWQARPRGGEHRVLLRHSRRIATRTRASASTAAHGGCSCRMLSCLQLCNSF